MSMYAKSLHIRYHLERPSLPESFCPEPKRSAKPGLVVKVPSGAISLSPGWAVLPKGVVTQLIRARQRYGVAGCDSSFQFDPNTYFLLCFHFFFGGGAGNVQVDHVNTNSNQRPKGSELFFRAHLKSACEY